MHTRILIVTGETLSGEALALLLESAGHDVVSLAHTAFEAIGEFIRHRPDIVIAEEDLPRLSGVELAHHLARLTPDPRVVLIGNDDCQDHAERIIGEEVHGYVLADDPGSELLAAVSAQIEGDLYFSRAIVPNAGYAEGRFRELVESDLLGALFAA